MFPNFLIYFLILFFYSIDFFSFPLFKSKKRNEEPELHSIQQESDAARIQINSASSLRRLLIKSGDKIIILDVNNIEWIESKGGYLDIHTINRQYLYRSSLGELDKKLDPEKFIRISRSYIVNIEHIKELEKYFYGKYLIVLNNGEKLKVSQKYTKFVMGRLMK